MDFFTIKFLPTSGRVPFFHGNKTRSKYYSICTRIIRRGPTPDELITTDQDAKIDFLRAFKYTKRVNAENMFDLLQKRLKLSNVENYFEIEKWNPYPEQYLDWKRPYVKYSYGWKFDLFPMLETLPLSFDLFVYCDYCDYLIPHGHGFMKLKNNRMCLHCVMEWIKQFHEAFEKLKADTELYEKLETERIVDQL